MVYRTAAGGGGEAAFCVCDSFNFGEFDLNICMIVLLGTNHVESVRFWLILPNLILQVPRRAGNSRD